MNYMKQVAEMLGVELEERFKLVDGAPHLRYRFNETGLVRENAADDKEEYCASVLNRLLNGEYEIEKLPWKPKIGETYWFADESEGGIFYSEWSDEAFDYAFYASGNCFKTKEEAEAAIPWYKENIERVNRGEKWQVEK